MNNKQYNTNRIIYPNTTEIIKISKPEINPKNPKGYFEKTKFTN